MTERTPTRLETGLHHGNLLNPAVRRDIADLNALYLDRALDARHGLDPWFQVPLAAASLFRAGPPSLRARVVQCPFTLFEFVLPNPAEAVNWMADAVADRAESVALDPAWTEARRAFGVTALAVVRRLAENLPMAPRIAFGLPATFEARLHAMSLSESYRVAAWPGLIRPRWAGNARFWTCLIESAIHDNAVHWAYAAGLCLLGQCESTLEAGQRHARLPLRHGARADHDVPC